jgi:hypothetical protein
VVEARTRVDEPRSVLFPELPNLRCYGVAVGRERLVAANVDVGRLALDVHVSLTSRLVPIGMVPHRFAIQVMNEASLSILIRLWFDNPVTTFD